MITAFALCLAQTVSFTSTTMPLGKLADELGKVTGETLVVSPDLYYKQLCIRVKDVDPQELLKQVAVAASGKWETFRDKKILVVDPKAVAEMNDPYAVTRRKKFSDYLNTKTEGIERQIQEFARENKQAILALKDGERLVFANPNNAMQGPLPADLARSFVQAVATNNQKNQDTNLRTDFEAALKGIETTPEIADLLRKIIAKNSESGAPQIPWQKVIVTVTAHSTFSVQVSGIDTVGNSFLLSDFSFYADEDEVGESTESATEKSPRFKLAEDTVTLIKQLAVRNDKSLLPHLRDIFGKPDEMDWCAEIASAFVDGYREVAPSNYVLDVTSSDAFLLQPIESIMKEQFDDGVPDPDGWTVCRTDRNMNMKVLRNFIDREIRGDEWTLDDIAVMSANFEQTYMGSFRVIRNVFDLPGIVPGLCMRVFGLLTPAQRAQAWKGQSIPVSSLPQNAKLAITRGAFIDEEFSYIWPAVSARFDFLATLRYEAEPDDIRSTDPTELFPNGFPKDAVITFAPKFRKGYLTSPTSKSRPLPLNMLIENFAARQRSTSYVMPRSVYEFDLEELTMNIVATPNIACTDSFFLARGRRSPKERELSTWGEFKDTLATTKVRANEYYRFMETYSKFMGYGDYDEQKGAAPPTR